MPEPRFSVVVPAYNGSSTIGATIESVLRQTEADLELIVVDDGSRDDTVGVVQGYRSDPRLKLIEQANQGTAAARNTGIAAARGEYIAVLDNDDLWMPDYLAQAGIALDGDPHAGFAYCDAWGFDDATRRFLRRTELESRPDAGPGADAQATLQQLVRVNFVMSSVCMRATALSEVGGFDPEVHGTDDYDLWLRIMLAGHGAVRAGDHPLLLQRGRHDSQSADETMMDRNLRMVLERVAANPRSSPEVVAAAKERIAEVDRALARRGGAMERLAGMARRVRDAVKPDRRWLERPPPEVERAFPDLVRR